MAMFILNPYEVPLDLNDKDDRKLFKEGSRGLKEEELFDGKKQNYSTFAKLIEKQFEDTRLMECMSIPTEWDDGAGTAAARRVPTDEGKIDFFKSYQGTEEQIKEHCDRVWADTNVANTPKYFDTFATAPANNNELTALRNQRKLKHVMMGNKLWNSLTSKYQIELAGSSKKFKIGNEYDGPLLWDFIRRRVNPSTTVGASRLKDELETVKLSEYENDVNQYNNWFDETKEKIIREEGATGYNEYLRNLFRAYLTCSDPEFVEAVKDEHRKWMQGRLPDTYRYTDLMELGRLTYNNLTASNDWKGGVGSKGTNKSLDEKNFLALATELIRTVARKQPTATSSEQGSDGSVTLKNGMVLKPWRFDNPNNESTKKLDGGAIMKWCENDCHPKPMWCGRRNCLNRANFQKHMDERRAQKGKSSESGGSSQNMAQQPDVSKDFRIALAAMTSAEDFDQLEKQFFSGN